MENQTTAENKEAFDFRKYQSGWDSQKYKKSGAEVQSPQ